MTILKESLSPLDYLTSGYEPINVPYVDYNQNINLNKSEEAIQWCDLEIRRNPNEIDNYLNKSYFLFELNRYQEAIECCNIAICLNPNDEDAYLNKGYVLNECSRTEEALVCYNQAISINQKNYDAHLIKGDLLMDLERYKDAIECYQKCLKIIPGDLEATKRNEFSIKMLNKNGKSGELASSKILKTNTSIKSNYYKSVSFRILKKNPLGLKKLYLKAYYELLMINMRNKTNHHITTQFLQQFSKTMLKNKPK